MAMACLMSSSFEYALMLGSKRLLILYNAFVKSLESHIGGNRFGLCALISTISISFSWTLLASKFNDHEICSAFQH